MKIIYRVQHVRGRDGPLGRLMAGMPPETEVVTDKKSDDPNPWRNYQRCLSDLPPTATHVVVVQDDAVVCCDFGATVANAITAKPEVVLSLFVGGLRNRTQRDFLRALAAERRWSLLHFRDIHHVVGLTWPVELAREFLEWAETARLPGHKTTPRSDDAIVGAWARLTHHEVWATVPSLVEHPDDVVSVANGKRSAGGADRGRVALSWLGAEADATAIDWST